MKIASVSRVLNVFRPNIPPSHIALCQQHGLSQRWRVSSSESRNRSVWGIITQISLTYTSICFKKYLNLKTANVFHKDTDTIQFPTLSFEVFTSKGTFVLLCTYIGHFWWNFSISHFSQLFFSPPHFPQILGRFSTWSILGPLIWPTCNLGRKMPKLAKITNFRKLCQVEVSARDMLLRIYWRKVLICF